MKKAVFLTTLNKVAPTSAESRSLTAQRISSLFKAGHRALQIRKICALAYQLFAITEADLEECFEYAIAYIEAHDELTQLLTSRTVKGQRLCRVVMEPAQIGWRPAGTGRPLKKGLLLFADVAKIRTMDPRGPIISQYKDRILELVA